MIPIELIIAGTAVISACLGFLLAVILGHGKARDAERRVIRQMENLYRARAIQDLRDSTRLF